MAGLAAYSFPLGVNDMYFAIQVQVTVPKYLSVGGALGLLG
jgi:hypothetical protein